MLRDGREDFRDFCDHANDLLQRVDANNRFIYVNRKWLDTLGYTESEAAGLTLNDILREDQIPHCTDVFDSVRTGRSVENVHTVFVGKGGREVHVEGNVSPRFENGEFVSTRGIFRDVTERRHTDEALRLSEELFRSLIENGAEGLVILDGDGAIRYESPSFERLLGLRPEDRVGGDAFQTVHPEDMPLAAEGFAEVLAKPGCSMRVEVRLQHKDGSWRNFEVVGRNLLHDPAVKGVVANLRDVTDRKRAEQGLRNTEAYYRALLDSSLDAIVILNADGSMRYVSPSYERVLGLSPDEMVGTGILERIHPDDVPWVAETFATFLEDRGGTLHAEVRARHGDGSWRHMEAEGNNLLGDPVVNGIVVSMRDVTERRQAEQALKESEERYRLLAENVSDVIWTVDMALRLTYVSPSVELMRGYTPDEVMSQSLDEMFTPTSLGIVLKTYADELSKESAGEGGASRTVTLEAENPCKDGSTVWVEMAMTPLRDEGGQITGILGTSRDISERKRSEEALRESEERYRLLAENVGDVIWTLDLNLKSTYISPSVVHLRGYTAEEAVAGGIERILTPASIEVAAKALAEEWALEETGGADPNRFRTLELEMYCKDGPTIWTEVKLGFMRAGEGPPIGILGVTRDISGRKKAEEALKASEESYRVVVDNAIEAILVAQDGMVKFLNPATIAMTGYSEEEIMSRPFAEFLHPEDGEMVYDRHVKRLEGEEIPSEYGFRVIHKDGKTRWVEVNVARISWGEKPAGMIFLRDITDKKRAEEERRRMEQQVQLAGRLAAVGELAAGVAHELNNPLTSVQAYAQLLKDRDDLDESARSDVATIYGEAQRASRITANLLSFARQHRPEKTFVSLNDVLHSSLELQAYRLKVNNIQVLTELAPDLPKTMVDLHQVQQVFVNLMTNAEQAMTGTSGGALTLKTETTDGVIRVSVADDGPGVRQEDLKRIFDPFFTTKEVGKGTGLGLSICYGIVREHGGRIWARNNPDRGATFTVELPIVSENAAS